MKFSDTVFKLAIEITSDYTLSPFFFLSGENIFQPPDPHLQKNEKLTFIKVIKPKDQRFGKCCDLLFQATTSVKKKKKKNFLSLKVIIPSQLFSIQNLLLPQRSLYNLFQTGK